MGFYLFSVCLKWLLINHVFAWIAIQSALVHHDECLILVHPNFHNVARHANNAKSVPANLDHINQLATLGKCTSKRQS